MSSRSMNQPKFTNRLIGETSPYLLQHAHNPVSWYPWGLEAIAKAKQDDKPILLSIGYSACHWCHVMEHESFADEDVAAYMNDKFVCVKVDREERPDLDKIYQTAYQLLTQRPGGWPLNVVISPDGHVPFFAGTYFPKQPRQGLPGFVDVLGRISEYYQNHRDRLREHGNAVRNAFAQIEAGARGQGQTDVGILERAFEELCQQYDPVYGGFGAAPKFPHPGNMEVCLRHWARSRDSGQTNHRGLDMVRHTLEAMAAGGIYDQLGGGFARYSVDDQWAIPHFEKMLYDNAQLLPLYTDAWRACGEPWFRAVALETGEWVMREMQSTDGGYFSSFDADSEGEEGKFYVWEVDELQQVLTTDEWAVAEVYFGLRGQPNFEGRWHLTVAAPPATVAERTGLEADRVQGLLSSARHKLLEVRGRRVWPGRDEKILTAWNGLMIKGMVHAGRFLDRDDFIQSAQAALDYVRSRLWHKGRLLATGKDNKTHLNAYLDDYVFLIDALLELLQARWRDDDLKFAISLAEVVLQHFQDTEYGGYFFTSDDHESLLHRHKPTTDDATPSGNGIAAQVLLRLGHLLGENRYLQAAEGTLSALSAGLRQHPAAHAALLLAVEDFHHSTETVVLRGDDTEIREAQRICQQVYTPRRTVLAIPGDAGPLPGVLAERTAASPLNAYVCKGHQCLPPVTSLEALRAHVAPADAGL